MWNRLLPPLLMIVLGGSPALGASGDCPEAPQTFDELKKLSDSLSPILGAAQIEDVQTFCKVNGYRDVGDSFDPAMYGKSSIDSSDWIGGFIPTADTREQIFANNMNDKRILSVHTARPLNAEEIAACRKDVQIIKNRPLAQGSAAQAGIFQSAFLCKDVTYSHALGCASAVTSLYGLVSPHGDVNLLDVWQKVFEDPTYVEVIKEVGLKNLAMIQHGQTPKSRFFDDLEQAFFERLKDHNKAKDYTFNLLGVLSSNGMDTWKFCPCTHVSFFKDAIHLLSLGSQTLDQRTAKNGFLYTYPKEVNSLCDYGKNYHFWMSAFLAREAAEQSGDKIAAAAAAFTLNKGYQFMKQGSGRDPTRAFKEDTFSNYNDNMRLDLAQAAAGAWYGAMSVDQDQKSLSREQFETGLRKIFEGAQQSPKDSNFQFPDPSAMLKMLSTYSTWKSTINPDAAYKYFGEQLGQ